MVVRSVLRASLCSARGASGHVTWFASADCFQRRRPIICEETIRGTDATTERGLGARSGVGRFLHRSGKQQHLTTAATMYRERSMTYWLEQAEAQVN